jgi:hypothetical protein
VLAQYRETIVVLEIERPDASRCMYCPAIWVDQDISLVRGLLQGWPKKMGSTWLTRSLPLDHPAAVNWSPNCGHHDWHEALSMVGRFGRLRRTGTGRRWETRYSPQVL